MFDFIEEISIKTGLPFDILNNGFRVINFNNRAIYTEGYVSIIEFELTQISIKLKKGILKIFGQDLKIREVNLNSILVVGEISNMEISWNVNF